MLASPSDFSDSVECENSGTLFADLLDTSMEDTDTFAETNTTSVMSDSDDDEMELYFARKLESTDKELPRYTDDKLNSDVLVVMKDIRTSNFPVHNQDDSYKESEVQYNKKSARKRSSTGLSSHKFPENSTDGSRNTDSNSKVLRPLTSTNVLHNGNNRCMSKNAVLARENRQRKKQYLEGLERKVELLNSENEQLKRAMSAKCKIEEHMKNEIVYLRSVIANQTGLSALLRNIQSTSGLSFSSSFNRSDISESGISLLKRRRPFDSDDSDTISSNNGKGIYVRTEAKQSQFKRVAQEFHSSSSIATPLTPCASPDGDAETSGGICLHVCNKQVSLEFCSSCAQSASGSGKKYGDHTYGKI